MDPAELAQRAGCTQEARSALGLRYFGQEYMLHPPAFSIEQADTGDSPSDFVCALILSYLATADGTPPSGQWISYRDLPGGMFYAQAFRGYAEVRLARGLRGGGVDAFRRGAETLGGRTIDIGHAGYAFQVFPHLHLAAVYWLGDEDFPSQASILFEDTAPHYMSIDGLAILGSQLVSSILRGCGHPNQEGRT
jgi:hypothetical protein